MCRLLSFLDLSEDVDAGADAVVAYERSGSIFILVRPAIHTLLHLAFRPLSLYLVAKLVRIVGRDFDHVVTLPLDAS